MGKSPSIAELAKKEDAYRQYLNKIEGELETKAKSYSNEMEQKINDYYLDNKWTGQKFVSGKNSDFMQKSEWSMKNVKLIIDSISKAIFGDSTAPSGVTIAKTEEIGKAIGKMENIELYIAGKCFEVLSGIIESFGSATTVEFNSGYKSVALGNGLHLFATVVCDSYKSESFFKNEEIYEYLYIYEVRFSTDEAKADAIHDIIRVYEDAVVTFNDKLEDLLNKLTTDAITGEQYETQSEIFNDLTKQYLAKIDALKANKALAEAR